MRKPVTWLLLVALFVSSSAVAATSRLVGVGQAATQVSVVDAHSQHGSVQHGSQSTPQDAQETYAHHYVAQGDNSAPADCPCCDNCGTMCVPSGCSPAAMTSASLEFSIGRDDSGILLADAMRASPTPHSLFRPPIPSA